MRCCSDCSLEPSAKPLIPEKVVAIVVISIAAVSSVVLRLLAPGPVQRHIALLMHVLCSWICPQTQPAVAPQTS